MQKNRNIFTRFPFVALSLTVLLGGLIYILHLCGLVTPANEVYARFIALGLFVVGVAILALQKAKNHRFSWGDFYKNDTFIVISLTLLLVSFFLMNRVSYYAIGLLVVVSLLHLLHSRKFYAPPKFFYFIIAYGLLMFLGTVGTQKGFHFPAQILCFYVLPLAFCCFNLSKKSLLKVGELFFKTGIIFLSCCILYWFYNFLHLDADFMTWITGKTGYVAQMTGWENVQAGLFTQHLGEALSKDTAVFYPAFLFVNVWSYFYHPTANAVVLLGGLIVGFYLYFQKDGIRTITKWGLLLYGATCLLTFLLIESRIGVVGFMLIVGISVLYFLKLKLKTKHFKVVLAVYILFVGASTVVFSGKFSNFINDDVRDAYRKVAVSYIQEHFWWGNGFAQQQIALEQQAEKIKDVLPTNVYPHTETPIHFVHNQYLGVMMEYGIWGLLVLSAMFVAIACYAVKNRSYPLLIFLCFILLFMWVEEGEHIVRLLFIMFFTAISEAEKKRKLLFGKSNL